MPSALSRATLAPVSSGNPIDPGTLYFGCLDAQRKGHAESYWIVLRVPLDWLPPEFVDQRPLQDRTYPFWVIGMNIRVWLPRTSLYHLDQSQGEVFSERRRQLDFLNTLTVVRSFRSTESALLHYRRVIEQSTKENIGSYERGTDLKKRGRSPSLSIVIEDKSRTSQSTYHSPGNTDKEQSPRKVLGSPYSSVISSGSRDDRRLFKRSCRDPVNSDTHKPRFAIQGTQSQQSNTKRHESRDLPSKKTMANRPVRIYIGQEQTEYSIDAILLRKFSPLLHSFISTDEENGDLIIKRSLLEDVDKDDFLLIMQFVMLGDYPPIMIANEDRDPAGPLALHGCNTTEDYSNHLVLAGRLYILAEKLQIPHLMKFIEHKIKAARYHDYTNMALIEFGCAILTRPSCKVGACTEHWIITELGERFMDIIATEVERKAYWEFARATVAYRVHSLVLEASARKYRDDGAF